MAVSTSNAYGNITIKNVAVAQIAGKVAEECYGVVEKVSRRFIESVVDLFRKGKKTRGVKIRVVKDRIQIDLHVVLKFGTSIKAVAESLRSTVKYEVENFTGTVVSKVNINVAGVKL